MRSEPLDRISSQTPAKVEEALRNQLLSNDDKPLSLNVLVTSWNVAAWQAKEKTEIERLGSQ